MALLTSGAALVVSGPAEIQHNGIFYSLSGGATGTILPDEVIHFALRRFADRAPVYKGTVVPQGGKKD